jgi:hypothetical protein
MQQILRSQFFIRNQERIRVISSFMLSLFFTFLILACLWNIVASRTHKKPGAEFTSEPSSDQGVRKKEHIVRLMMRQRASTPKKSTSTFQAKAISDIVAPEPEFNLEVTDLAPAVTPTEAKGFSLRGDLDFSVFKMGNFNTRLRRAGAKRGFITVSLMWDNYNDLDLHCIGPNREEIFYKNRKGKFGELDVDMNAGSQRSREPVENLYFPNRVSGRYQVRVNHYSNKGGKDPTPFTVLIRVEGRKEIRLRGKISAGQPKKEIYAVNIR